MAEQETITEGSPEYNKAMADKFNNREAVSYTHLTLPTKA